MYTYKAHVTKVYDGDTITANVDLGMGVWLKDQKIRLFGLNAPELRGESRNEGIKARDFLRKLVLNKEVTLVTYKDEKGKWGRWLGDIFITDETGLDICVNSVLIMRGFAKPYEV